MSMARVLFPIALATIRRWTGAALIAATAAAGLLLPTPAAADYSPGYSSYLIYDPALVVGPNGTLLLKSSALSSDLALSDIQSHYTAATGYSRVVVPSGNADCGYADGCVFFDVKQTQFEWWPACTTNNTSSAGDWATLYVAADAWNNTNCNGLGSDYAPVWVAAVNPSNVQNGWYGYQHLGRHEVGHALGMDEAGVSCWTESRITGYLPLMNNGPCPGPYRNIYLTSNEIAAIIARNGW